MMGRVSNDMVQVIAATFVIAFISVLVDKLMLGKIGLYIRRTWRMV